MDRKINVIVIDDSAVVRKAFKTLIKSDTNLNLIGTAIDPIFARRIMENQWPDVIILDIEMPRMDGITFLRQIMDERPTPTIICSSLTGKGARVAFEASALGAVDIVTKPKMGVRGFLEESSEFLLERIHAAAAANVTKIKSLLKSKPKVLESHERIYETTEKIILIGASTGGTHAIELILKSLPRNVPGILVVQHMPEGFTKKFSERLNDICELTIKEAENGELVKPGTVFIAHGNRHLHIRRSGAMYKAVVSDGPRVNLHRPSVDVLFRSGAKFAGKSAFGIILTGMGADGAMGLLEMRNTGAHTCAQDEESCIVFGMPKSAIERGAAKIVLPLKEIPKAIMKSLV